MGDGSFEDFTRRVEARLKQGRVEYGDRSYTKDGVALIDEIIEELADVCGWSVILFGRLKKLREKMASLEGKS